MTLIFQILLLKDFLRDKIGLYNQNTTVSRQAKTWDSQKLLGI